MVGCCPCFLQKHILCIYFVELLSSLHCMQLSGFHMLQSCNLVQDSTKVGTSVLLLRFLMVIKYLVPTLEAAPSQLNASSQAIIGVGTGILDQPTRVQNSSGESAENNYSDKDIFSNHQSLGWIVASSFISLDNVRMSHIL